MSLQLAQQSTLRIIESHGWRRGTAPENLFALALHRAGFDANEVHQQFQFGPFRLDFAIPRHQLAIEVDGWFHGHPDTQRTDRQRDRTLQAWGWLVHRVAADDEEGMAKLAARVASFVSRQEESRRCPRCLRRL